MANIGPNEPPKLVGNEFGKCFCVLCSEIIEVFKNVVLVCTHCFHENCLKNWKKDICPICRKPQEIFEVFPTKATSSKPPRRHPTGDVNHLMHSETTLEHLEEKYSPQFEKAWTSEKVKDLVPKTLFNEAKKSLHVANKLMQEKKFEQSYAMVMRCDHLMEVVRECSEFYTFLRNNEQDYRLYRDMTSEILSAFYKYSEIESIHKIFKFIPAIVFTDVVDKDKFSFSI